MTLQSDSRPDERIWQITNGAVLARCLQVVAEAGVADAVADEPAPVPKLAAECGVHPEALDRVLALLAAAGIFRRTESGYEHTDSSRLLRSDHPTSMRDFSRMMGLPSMWALFGELGYSLRTGQPAVTLQEPAGFFAWLEGRPTDGAVFGRAMTAKAHADIAGVLSAYRFAGYPTIADIGGGQGHLLQAIIDSAPGVRGVLFDLPEVVDRTEFPSPRITATAGDFFVGPLPPADLYILMEVLHDWPDEQAKTILRNVRQAGEPGSTLLIVEAVIPDGAPDPRCLTLDVIMLTVTGGRERRMAELDGILAECGFRLDRVIETGGPSRLVEATAT
jgi:hypothetical protein